MSDTSFLHCPCLLLFNEDSTSNGDEKRRRRRLSVSPVFLSHDCHLEPKKQDDCDQDVTLKD